MNEQIPDADLGKVITAALLADQGRFDEADIKVVEQKIADYFFSGKADLQIESEKSCGRSY